MELRYSMVIEWSEEDQLFLARLPEWGPYAVTHGHTYLEAAARGQEVLEMLVQSALGDGKQLPEPQTARTSA